MGRLTSVGDLITNNNCMIEVRVSGDGPTELRASSGGMVELWALVDDLAKARASGGGSVKVRNSGGGSVKLRASGSGPMKVRASGISPVKVRASGDGPTKARASGGGPGKARASGGGPMKLRASGCGLAKVRASGGGLEKVRASDGGSVKVRTSGGGPAKLRRWSDETPTVVKEELFPYLSSLLFLFACLGSSFKRNERSIYRFLEWHGPKIVSFGRRKKDQYCLYLSWTLSLVIDLILRSTARFPFTSAEPMTHINQYKIPLMNTAAVASSSAVSIVRMQKTARIAPSFPSLLFDFGSLLVVRLNSSQEGWHKAGSRAKSFKPAHFERLLKSCDPPPIIHA
ncbi:hypothetical protein MA16_Dca017962 [Dendrobium catenatum]|uniref:Uncharacterized protein n=1 Tax=Dendrobium catenatum TaxID=906689 RepID=A0A2I0X9I8_9ASPA|nr:hypothetical protein MA16_Dca017962 [Dendrobium catenatum]